MAATRNESGEIVLDRCTSAAMKRSQVEKISYVIQGASWEGALDMESARGTPAALEKKNVRRS
jgi:hypothetical protein